jgi:hypothetical protein
VQTSGAECSATTERLNSLCLALRNVADHYCIADSLRQLTSYIIKVKVGLVGFLHTTYAVRFF